MVLLELAWVVPSDLYLGILVAAWSLTAAAYGHLEIAPEARGGRRFVVALGVGALAGALFWVAAVALILLQLSGTS